MSDVMRIQPFATQLRRVLMEYERKRAIFDIPAPLFYTPRKRGGLRHEHGGLCHEAASTEACATQASDLFGRRLDTPIGPSAGPHTQLSQNIVASWLCGGRFIELKTVQVRDDLVIPRPCIDMTDEGYNVEWSQELRLDESAHEYVVAWALMHVLPRILGWEAGQAGTDATGPGAIFDMSVGYDLAGIRDPRMTRFMDVLEDASEPLDRIAATIRSEFPRFADVEIPRRIANSVTLSTMHGCPPDEIERIARYCLEERGLHTVVKLNPTLLGKEAVLAILHEQLGFTDIRIPDSVFDHDLQYDRAVSLITSLKSVAATRGLTFGVKLSNTLAMTNHAGRLPGGEMYMSGRALYPVTMRLYDRLLHEFDGNLHVSYSAGVDAENVASVVACGALPVTGCTDLLKPGGVGRMTQWLERLQEAMEACDVASLSDLSRDRLASVRAAADEAGRHPRYKKRSFQHGLPKVTSPLGLWDCVVAPCVEACAVEQDVPEYSWLIAAGEYDRALEVILARNPLPGVTGYVCTRLCQTRCTRNDYEESVAIRALKRVAEERGRADYLSHRKPSTDQRVAVVGSGPSGLAAAAFLALNGAKVTIFEARDVAGGMMRVVPPFRLPIEIIRRDIDRILALGVELRLSSPVTAPPEQLLGQGFDAVYLASGFQRDTPLRIPGIEGPGVMPALQLLDRSRRGERVDLGRKAVVVGGGDTAMDAVRTAQRCTGEPVTLLYRRTRHEMPAAEEELEGALEEGNVLEELVSPVEIVREDDRRDAGPTADAGRVTGVRCVRNTLGEPGPDGRRSPVATPGSEFVVACDTVIVAVGQLPELAFLDGSRVARHRGGGVLVDGTTRCAGPEGVFAGGDVVVEPGSIISACADGRLAAEAICDHLGIPFATTPWAPPILSEQEILEVKKVRARRVAQAKPGVLPAGERRNFSLIEATFTDQQARAEGLRCVQCTTFCDKCVEVCPNRANYTFVIQPVRWLLPVLACDEGGTRVFGTEAFEVRQPRQILHVDDFCNECDDCQTFCVHQGKPYTDKPRLFLDRSAFAAEQDNAFHIEGDTIVRRENGRESRLTRSGDQLVYEDDGLQVRLTRDWQVTEVWVTGATRRTWSLRSAAEMAVLLDGVSTSLPFLLI
jgi:putative selenate reductase